MEVKRIGDAAGRVWQKLRLAEKGSSVSDLKKLGGFSSDEVVAALGWLAREGKVEFQAQGKKVQVTLVETELFV